MKAALLSLVVCAALACSFSPAFAADAKKDNGAAKKEDKAKKPINAKCPLMDEDIDPKVTTVYKGKTVAFCCESCIDDFKKDPEKYMKKIEAQNKKAKDAGKGGDKDKKAEKDKVAKPVNALCVVHPEDAVDPTVTAEYDGKLIGFCCEDCLKKFDLDPKAYAAKLKK